MSLKNYFALHRGTGILTTADSAGKPNTAVFARPTVMEDGSLALIMRDRLTYHNLQENPAAHYLFIEQHPGYRGTRLALRMLREDQDPALVARLTRRNLSRRRILPQARNRSSISPSNSCLSCSAVTRSLRPGSSL